MTLYGKLKIRFQWWLNRMKMKISGVELGKGDRIGGRLCFRKGRSATIRIGKHFTWSGTGLNPLCQSAASSLAVENGAFLQIGDNVGISGGVIWVMKGLTIGNHVKIGADCMIFDSNCHSLDHLQRRDDATDSVNAESRPIEIGDDVLIGARCCILKGVKIGARSIIGAGSVVTRSIPEDCIVAGNPCEIIRKKAGL